MKRVEVSQYYECRYIKVVDETTDRIVAAVVDFIDGRHVEFGLHIPENYKLALRASIKLDK